jgi:hypothetical protein
MRSERKDLIETLKLFAELKEQLKILEREASALRDAIIAENPKDGFIQAGSILAVFNNKKRTSLDRKALEQKLGDELKNFEVITEYIQIDLKKVA